MSHEHLSQVKGGPLSSPATQTAEVGPEPRVPTVPGTEGGTGPPGSTPGTGEVSTSREEDRAQAHSHTCGLFAVLDLCEQAHRDVTGKPLCLNDQDLRTQEIKAHLATCPLCQRWYHNARRAYARLARQAAETAPKPILAYKPRPRVPIPILAGARGPDVVYQRLKPEPEGEHLDALSLLLDWNKVSRGRRGNKGKGRWWLTLKFLSRQNDPEGNKEEDLQRYEGLRIRLATRAGGVAEPDQVTRLGLDPQRNLVSTPCCLGLTHPNDLENVTLIPDDWVKGIDGA
jgi:hypothetical protein